MPLEILNEVLKFLEVDPSMASVDTTPRNVGANEISFNQNAVDYLNQHFGPFNTKLCAYLERDFDW